MISAKYYIKDKELLQQFQCDFCHEVNYQLLLCSQRCQKQYCKDCFKILRYRQCRFCEENFKGIYIPLKEVQFLCPSQQCKAILHTPQDFDRHCIRCEQLSNEIKEEFYCKANYLCSKGHLLESELSRSTCCRCLQNNNYTSGCHQCRDHYCTNCRPPPCSKKQCSIGHELRANSNLGSITCDLCALPIATLTDSRIFSDRNCDFDVCYSCHFKLPEEHPLPQYKEIKQKERERDRETQMEIEQSEQSQQSGQSESSGQQSEQSEQN